MVPSCEGNAKESNLSHSQPPQRYRCRFHIQTSRRKLPIRSPAIYLIINIYLFFLSFFVLFRYLLIYGN